MDSRWRRLARSLTYGVLVAGVVGVLALLVRTQFDPLIDADQGVIDAATGFIRDHDGLRAAATTWEAISQPWVVYLVVGLPACLYVWLRQGLPTRACWAAVTMASGWAVAVLFKLVVHRARPELDAPFVHHAGFSFPSGHAANNAIVVTVVLLLSWRTLSVTARAAGVAVGATWLLVTCADRVFLGAHFPSDVVAGVLLGCGLSLASYAGYLGWRPPVVPAS